jgi:hypothetical protein
MTNIRGRLGRIESEVQFRAWVSRQRVLEAMSIGELETLAATGQWPDRPEPAPGTSRLDAMDRPSLIKLWRKDLETFGGRNSDELEFYALHGQWPEQDPRSHSSSDSQSSCSEDEYDYHQKG